jgi:branched-chain amino acid transport system ATP-binding protein
MFLEVRDLTVHYEKVEAIRKVSLSVGEGQCICIIGSNGAGKSTILRTISGLKKATSGQIVFDGKRVDLLPAPKVVGRGISMVPEGRLIFPDMSVSENLLMGAYLRKDKSVVDRDLEDVLVRFPILRQRQKQVGGSLSGGEQQMLTIGRSLMSRPRILLLDEPTLGLAPLVVGMIAEIVREINKSGISVVLVEQNSLVALRVSQRGYVLETGSVVLEDDSVHLIDNEYVRKAYLGG